MPERVQRASPIFTQKPHLCDPSGAIAVWHTEPPGLVLQLLEPREGTVELVNWIGGPSREAMLARFGPDTELYVLFDVRLLTGRDPAARAKMIELAKDMKSRTKRVVILPPRAFSPALMRTLDVTVSILRVFGLQIGLAQTPSQFIVETGVRPLPVG